MIQMSEKTTTWTGCYKGGWQGIMVPEAFSHPAKFSRRLIERIFEHAVDEGWLQEGDTVLDPFGGVALGAWPALPRGINWLGIELEGKFVGLGFQNLALWDNRYRDWLPKWGRAFLVQGDSRELASALSGQVDGCIASPPYATLPTNDAQRTSRHKNNDGAMNGPQPYGSHPAQLGNMPAGSVELDACIASPPYIESLERRADRPKSVRARMREKGWSEKSIRKASSFHSNDAQGGYGTTDGQLAAMPEGELKVDACVASPPWEGTNLTTDEEFMAQVERDQRGGSRLQPGLGENGDSEGQLGNSAGDTFWSAARTIIQQVYQVLKPGGMAIWVLKDFVRSKKIVPFCAQWQRVAESCGFETVEIIRALLTEDRGAQYMLDGALVKHQVKRCSFFRRLHERKYPHLAIDYETVLCQRKPAAGRES